MILGRESIGVNPLPQIPSLESIGMILLLEYIGLIIQYCMSENERSSGKKA
jgi:hypothetical protein